MKARKLGTFKLKFEFTTTDEMNSALGSGVTITRKPPTGLLFQTYMKKITNYTFFIIELMDLLIMRNGYMLST